MPNELPQWAFYYPNPFWFNGDGIKNLILFFDGIALLVPEYMHDRPYSNDPAITIGLQQYGLLKILEPETFINKNATEKLAEAMTDIIVSGALDNLAKEPTQFQELSYSRLGYMADAGLAKMIFEELEKRKLATPSKDGVSIPMHPIVRSLVLTLLAQILRPAGQEKGLDLCPATDRPEIVQALTEVLRLPSMPSTGHVVSLDLQTVGVDLSAIPIDEVLSFRAQYQDQYRDYRRSLHQFVREIGSLSNEEQQTVIKERQEEIQEKAAQLRKIAHGAWKQKVSFALGLAGAFWMLKSGDVIGGLLALGAGIAGARLSTSLEAGAYSYLFNASRRFS